MTTPHNEKEGVMPPVPVHPGGLFAELHDTWRSNGWLPDDLKRFRMGPEEDELDELSEDEITALQALSPDDVTALKALTPEQLKALSDHDELDARIREARNESATRRRELKPWRELAKELGMTPEQIRAALKKAPKVEKPKGDPEAKPEVDVDEVRREAKAESDAKANRRIVRSEVKVLARDLFAAPDDAPLYVDLDEYEVDDDGDLVDEDEVIAALKKVLKDKPHLAKKPVTGKRDKAQGEREHDAKPSVSRGKEMFEDRKPKKAS